MKRREFIALVSGAFAWPISVHAQAEQRSQSHRIAFVSAQLPRDMTEDDPVYRPLFAELRRIGYIEGHNLVVERYSTWGLKEPFSELAASVVRQKPDLICALGSRLVLALKLTTTAIPIVGLMADPVAFGIVESLGRPGGNITGVSTDAGMELYGKQLELLKEPLPQFSSVGYLASRGVWEGPTGVEVREAAQHLGISLFGAILESFQEAEYRRVFAAMKQEGVAGILVNIQAENIVHRKLIVDLATHSRLPTLYPVREYVELSGLMRYGPSRAEYLRRGAGQLGKSTRFSKAVNLVTYRSIK
jgi:putative tryptophan/tyrosine transport system substrate-binding protein